MVATLTKPKVSATKDGGTGSSGGSGGGPSGRGGGTDNHHTAQIGLWLFLATVTMLFAGLTSALIIRRSSPDWQPIYFPHLLWLNTGVILLSSLTLEIARASLSRSQLYGYRFWMALTALLGCGFLAGQILAWLEMAGHGIFLPTNPHSSFFYLLTGLHGLHLLGGIVVLFVACVRAFRLQVTAPVGGNLRSLGLAATYWHFLDGLWIYLLFLLFYLG